MDKLDLIERKLKDLRKRVERLEKLFSIQQSHNFENSDELLNQATNVVKQYDRVSASLLQRRLKIGYARASRLMDLLESKGIVSELLGGDTRKVLKKT